MTYENPYMNGQIWPELNILEILRQRNPLVICITNDVVRTFTANGLLAIGASPVMSECSEDLKDLIVHASALLINIGTLTPDKVSYYKDAIALAKKHEVPIVLDPVDVKRQPSIPLTSTSTAEDACAPVPIDWHCSPMSG